MKRFLSLLLGCLLVVGSLGPGFALPAAAAVAIAGAADRAAVNGVALPITDVQITGIEGTIPVKLLVSHGDLAMSTTTGLTFDGPSGGPEIYFSGDVDDVNAALATLTYTREGLGADTLEVSLVESGEVFFPGNGHLYEYIPVGGGVNWNVANAAAGALTRYGAAGYLVTITSAEENAFAAARLEGEGWMGASDVAVEGTWRWVTGPETGDLLTYTNWNDGEPNNASNEDCGQFLSGGSGQWNDLPCSGFPLAGYVVEFGAPGDLPDTAGADFTITTYDAPILETVSPADGATKVGLSDNLVLSFDQDVEVGTGNISIYRANGSLITQVDVESDRVTGSGTDTITVDPARSLPPRTAVYVLIDDTAFLAVEGGPYIGIDSNTTWNFETRAASSDPASPAPTLQASLASLTRTCDGRVTGLLTLEAERATDYLVSEDPLFLRDAWMPLATDKLTLPWTFTGSTARLYVMVRGAAAQTATVQVTGVPVAPVCEEPIVIEDPSGVEDWPQMWRSPWNGIMEPVTDVTGMTLIRGTDYDTVYLLRDGVRYPFMNQAIYFTWYSDFSGVQTVTNATLGVIPVGAPVLPRPGSLVKIVSRPDVYVVVERAGAPALECLDSEEAARGRFGDDWADLVQDLDVTLFNKFAR